MINITVTEKLWDGVRPGSVKKTGLSEAIRAFAKVPKNPDSAKAFDDTVAAVKDLSAALSKAEAAVKKAKDDKKGAAAKLKAWLKECDDAVTTLTGQRKQLGLSLASKEADGKMKDLAQRVEEAITQAEQLCKDIEAGKVTDLKTASQSLQDFRSAMRDGLKATQKDGFAQFIATFDQVMAWKVDPAEVPMPPNAKKIKDRLPVLQEAAEKARVGVEEVLVESGQSRTGEAAEAAKDLVADYRKLMKNLKAFVPAAKKFSTDVKAIGDKIKALVGQGKTHDQLLPAIEKVHDKIMAADEATMKELARGRVSSGDIQAKRIKIRDSLKGKKEVHAEFEKIASEEWNFCMTVYRETSEQIAEAHRQVERVLRLVGESSTEAAAACENLKTKFEAEIQEVKNRYLK
jgi:hypothetical protein